MTSDKAYTDADVELVARWFRRWLGASTIRQRDRDCAVEILSALAVAGRILPGDGAVAIECDIDWIDVRGDGRHAQAKSYAWKPEEYDRLLAKEIHAAAQFHRAPVKIRKRSVAAFGDGSKLVGPWQPVEVPL
ncbi:hypothetical protein JNW88_00340 [Micromonospora sp. ATA32]|nr:hypothetical protein [Micromonospora sp. ATA32]